MEKITAWIKANLLIAIIIAVGIITVFFGRQVKKIVFGTRRVKHRRRVAAVASARRRRSLPRSVGLHKRNKPAVAYNKDGTKKKPWQIKGSEAARRHMAKIRRLR